MPDWNALLRERLKLKDLPPAIQKETIAELASHLDDLCADYQTMGLSESAAVECALSEIAAQRVLSRDIRRAKLEEGTMNHRTKRFWLPGLVSTAIALVLPILSFEAITREPIVMAYLRSGSTPEILWLLASAFGGATGASLSRRAGGKSFARLASALFPVVVFVVAICGFALLAPSFGSPSFEAYQLAPWLEMARYTLPTISVFGAVLLLGALPFMRPRRGGESEVSHA